jgi:hypothetical protein
MLVEYLIITGLINAVSTAVLGIIVYLKNSKQMVNRTFAIFCSSVAAWSGFYFLWLFIGNTEESAFFWGRALNIAAIFTPITYIHFVTVFLGVYEKKKKLIMAGYLLALVLFISGFTSLFVPGVAPEGSIRWYPQPGPTYHVFILMFFSYVIYGWYLLFKAFEKNKGKASLPIKYVLIGTFLGFSGGATNFLYFYSIPIPPYGNGLVVFIFIFTALAILKYRLFEVRVILTELLVVIIAGVSLAEALIFKDLWARVLGFSAFGLFCLIGYLLIRSMNKEIRANEFLEQRVEERTLELKQSNDKLIKAFDELKEKQQELEKWYNLTIGRELRMAELKEKIKEMEEKPGSLK